MGSAGGPLPGGSPPADTPAGESPPGPQRPFEERLQELEALAERLKDGEVPLAEAVDLFERGMRLARGLGAELAKVERRIEIMINEPELTDEAPLLAPFADGRASGDAPPGGEEEAPF